MKKKKVSKTEADDKIKEITDYKEQMEIIINITFKDDFITMITNKVDRGDRNKIIKESDEITGKFYAALHEKNIVSGMCATATMLAHLLTQCYDFCSVYGVGFAKEKEFADKEK